MFSQSVLNRVPKGSYGDGALNGKKVLQRTFKCSHEETCSKIRFHLNACNCGAEDKPQISPIGDNEAYFRAVAAVLARK
jgi:hypothetical protein